MPKKEQIPQGGTKLPQKPMPKQDKGGGIIPAAEGARVVLANSAAGRQFAAPLLALFRPLLALKPRETRG